MRQKLFQPFAQGHATLARTAGGLGLGLALVKGLVELHGGTVSAHSAGSGAGAEFSFTLPLEADFTCSVSHEPQPVCAGEGRRVLVVEDNEDAAQSLRDVLELAGHEVHLAPDGAAGVEMAEQVRPDVVLCDIGLPGMSGYDVARALRRPGSSFDGRLVALTGYATPEDEKLAAEAGFDDHLAKPASLDQLMAVLGSRPRA
jgi:two-component system CheB/CheR fusion protein